MKLLLKRQVRVDVANKVKPINMTKVATESRKPASSKFIHLSALRAYRRRKAWKLNVRRISNFQFIKFTSTEKLNNTTYKRLLFWDMPKYLMIYLKKFG